MTMIWRIWLFIATVVGVFGLWGYYSTSGQIYFDEMNGLIPFFGLLLSGCLFLIFAFTVSFLIFRRK